MDRYSTIPQRIVASIIDGLLFLPAIVVSAIYSRHAEGTPIGYAWSAWMVVVTVGFSVYFHGLHGATPGKSLMKVRLVRAEGEGKIGFLTAFVRESPMLLVGIANLFQLHWAKAEMPAVATVIGFLTGGWMFADVAVVLINRKRRALHDFLAGAVVVREESDKATVDAPPAIIPAHLEVASTFRRVAAGFVNFMVFGSLAGAAKSIATGTEHTNPEVIEKAWLFGMVTAFWILCVIAKKSLGALICNLEVRDRDFRVLGFAQWIRRSLPYYVLAVSLCIPNGLVPAWIDLVRWSVSVLAVLAMCANGLDGVFNGRSFLDRWLGMTVVQFKMPDHMKTRIFSAKIG